MNHFEDIVRAIKKVLFVPIHPAGWPIIAIFFAVTFFFFLIDDSLGVVGMILSAWCVYFFRDPARTVPVRPGLVVSPADGVVSAIETGVTLPKELDEADTADDQYTRVSIFLNVFNVHVNRVPIEGQIKQVVYTPGKFLNANLDKASEENERSAALIESEAGKTLAFVQIAGLVARRIICDLKDGQKVATGEKYGIIRFGSRADVYLPKGVNPLVCVGQTMVGGETVLADVKAREKAREGIKRA